MKQGKIMPETMSETSFTAAHVCQRSRSTIRDVMRCISEAAQYGLPGGLALIVDDAEVLEGIITDGDIRRALLAGATLDTAAGEIMVRDPIVFKSHMSYRQILEEIPSRLASKGRYRGGVLEKVILVDTLGRPEGVLDFIDLWRNQNMRHRHVCVAGMGYVGLTLAVTMAEAGYRVTGVDPDATIRASLRSGRPHFHEVGLEPLLRQQMEKFLAIDEALPRDAEVYIITVGTPVTAQDQPDTSFVETSARQVGEVLGYGDLVVLRSTVPVGTCRGLVLPILERASALTCGRDFHLAFAPERTVEGKALAELRSLPQVVGGFDENSADLTANLFRELTPSIITVDSLEEAEMVKLINNSFRDLSFGFANELALICEAHNLDATAIVNVANDGYPRNRIPVPSPGVGGACLKKDPYMYAHVARQAGLGVSLSYIGRGINEEMPGLVVRKVIRALERAGKSPEEASFFLIGFAFKGEPETSDVRNSTTLDILALIKPVAREIRGYDPVVSAEEIGSFGVEAVTLEEGFKGADCVLVLNNHRSYADMDFYANLRSMNRPAVYCDTWRIFAPGDAQQVDGITYVGLGFMS